MSRTAMRRLRAANPISDPPAPRPIDTVIPGWAPIDRLLSDRPSGTEAAGHGRRASRRSTSGSRRYWSGLPAALGVGITIAVVVFALVGVQATKKPAGTAGTPTSTLQYTDAQGWSLTYPSAFRTVQGLPGTTFARQVTITSFPAPRKLAGRWPGRTQTTVGTPPYVLPLDAAGRFPADGVALILQPSRAFVLGPDSAFPVALAQLGRAHAEPFFSRADDR